MPLDVFSPAASDQDVMRNAAPDLPAGFSEAFDISLRSIGEWHNSNADAVARERALATYYDDVKAKTGVQLPLYGLGGNVSIDELNTAIGKLPQLPGETEPSFHPLTEADVDNMALQRMRQARQDAAAFSRRETTFGGSLGTIAGTLIAGVSDPVAAATLPLGGAGELGIIGRSLEFAAIAGGTEAVTSAAIAPARERAVPGSLGEIPGEIATATLFGGVLGAGIGGLQKLLGHGAKTLPVTVRDDLNAAASEAQLNLTNPFPTAAGEAAARDATIDATRSAARGEPVTAGESFAPGHVADYALAAKSQTPEELAIAGEKHLRPETYGEAPDVERFDRMPSETDDTASYWDKRLEAATPEERAALGATDNETTWYQGVHANAGGEPVSDYWTTSLEKAREYSGPDGHVFAARESAFPQEALATRQGNVLTNKKVTPGEPYSIPPIETIGKLPRSATDEEFAALARPREIAAPYLTPAQMTALEAEPKVLDAAAHDLDHYIAANPDAEFTTQTRMPDGSYQFQTQKLADVMKELDGFESAAKELEACVIGLQAAE